MTYLVLFFVGLAIMFSGAAGLVREALHQKKVKEFWYNKWIAECEAHLETARDAEARDQGLFEIQESYEMDRLQARETIASLNGFREAYEPHIDHWVRLDRFHKETCAPLLAQVKRGAR